MEEEEPSTQEASSQQAAEHKASSHASDGSSDGLRRGQGQEAEKAKRKHKRLTKPRHFDEYSYHIPHIELKSGVIVSQKVRYIMDEALSDLGFRNVMSIDFWISLIILLLTMWIRAYMHTFGSWIILKLTDTPITEFEPMMYNFCGFEDLKTNKKLDTDLT